MQQNYDKFTYSHQRNRSEREESSYKSPKVKSKKGQQQFPQQHDASISVLNPLKHGAYSFAVAEDGILHSRIVSPPRICYAPVISELDAPQMPDTPWDRLKKLLKLTSSESNNNNQNEEVDLAQFGSLDWDYVVSGIKALEEQDLEREQILASTLHGADTDEETMTRKIALYKDRKSILEAEKVTPVDRAKIELIWKRARMMLVDIMNRDGCVQQQQQQQPLDSSTSYEDVAAVPVAAVKRTTTSSRGSSRASSPAAGGGSRASSRGGTGRASARISRENSLVASSSGGTNPYGGRGTIFNEKLRWTDKPRVDSNNNTSSRSRRF